MRRWTGTHGRRSRIWLLNRRGLGMRREGLLKKELAELERRWQAAQARTEELASTVPEATRPLLRQLEAMQAAAAGQQEAWLAAERNLTLRLQDAEASAAAAGVPHHVACCRLWVEGMVGGRDGGGLVHFFTTSCQPHGQPLQRASLPFLHNLLCTIFHGVPVRSCIVLQKAKNALSALRRAFRGRCISGSFPVGLSPLSDLLPLVLLHFLSQCLRTPFPIPV